MKDSFTHSIEQTWNKIAGFIFDAMRSGHVATDEDIVCDLCQRPRPIFFVDGGNSVIRLQDKYLPEFLKQLKQDYI